MKENLTVAAAVGSNIAAAIFAKALPWVDNVEPILHLLIGAGQIAVAFFTAWYLWVKIRNIKKDKE